MVTFLTKDVYYNILPEGKRGGVQGQGGKRVKTADEKNEGERRGRVKIVFPNEASFTGKDSKGGWSSKTEHLRLWGLCTKVKEK